jgi:hypothetical protein
VRVPPKFNHKEVVFCESKCVDETRSVQVLIPTQGLKVKTKGIPYDAYNPHPYSKVTPVTNFVVCQIKGEEELPYKNQDLPFELRVGYTSYDWKRSLRNEENEHKKPWLVFWDSQAGWQPFSDVKIIPVDDDELTGGFLVVQIDIWDDPPIGIV